MERQPQQPDRWSDDDSIDYNLERTTAAEENIGHGAARTIAAQIDSPGSPAIHTFVTTDAIIGEQLFDELGYEMNKAANDLEQARIEAPVEYCFAREDDGPVQDWARVWVETPERPFSWNEDPESNDCAACGEHFTKPHALGCPLDPEQFKISNQPPRITLGAQLSVSLRTLTDDSNLRGELWASRRRTSSTTLRRRQH